MRIHRVGYKIIFFTFVILIGLNYLIFYLSKNSLVHSVVQFSSGLFWGLIIFFFRNPSRKIIENPYFILSPADGTIIEIRELFEDEFFNEKKLMISIFMSLWNVHKNWIPTSGTVEYIKHYNGKFLLAYKPKAYLLNEHNNVVINNSLGRKILVRQVAGKIARRIVCNVKVGDKVKQGNELGFIKFGSRVDVILPLDAKVKVKLNQKVFGGLTVLADLYPKNN